MHNPEGFFSAYLVFGMAVGNSTISLRLGFQLVYQVRLSAVSVVQVIFRRRELSPAIMNDKIHRYQLILLATVKVLRAFVFSLLPRFGLLANKVESKAFKRAASSESSPSLVSQAAQEPIIPRMGQ